MKRHFDTDLQKLKEDILEMGQLVQLSVDRAVQGLAERKQERFEEVYSLEKQINQLHMAIDEECVLVLARNAPVASYLRLVVAIIKINNDLERMGDQAVNISHNSEMYIREPELKPLVDIPRMAEYVREMIQKALDSLLALDAEKAQWVLAKDKEVNHLKDSVLVELTDYIEREPSVVKRAINLILIARNLERLGDHATNIAEDVIYIATGDDVRHGTGKKVEQS